VLKPSIHPKAFLTLKRNVKAGLIARTKIIFSLETGNKKVNEIREETGLTYSCIVYHLKSLRREKLVSCSRGKKPYHWSLTAFGQQKLMS
jgi:predicted transcriptional regulator